MAALFVFLGVWQFNRNTHKHQIEVREKAAYAAPAPDVTAAGGNHVDGSRVEASGTFDGAHETVLRNQVKNDNVGVDVLTPLRLADGTAVLVDRGWVRASATSGVTTDPPPGGTAVVHGLAHTTNPLSPQDTVNHLADGRLAVPRVDLAAIGRTLPYQLAPVWIEAQAIQPAPHGQRARAPSAPAARSGEPHGVRDRVVRVRADPAHRLADRAVPAPASAQARPPAPRPRAPTAPLRSRAATDASGAGRAARDRRRPRGPATAHSASTAPTATLNAEW